MRIHRLRRASGTVIAVLVTASSLSAAGQSLPVGGVADRIVIEKAARTLALYRGDRLLKTYRVALGPNAKGAKERQGDGRTPEGRYIVDSRKRDGAFHRALHISYPNEQDKEH
jgi:murein L,D-transpeptidase YafK